MGEEKSEKNLQYTLTVADNGPRIPGRNKYGDTDISAAAHNCLLWRSRINGQLEIKGLQGHDSR